MRYSKIQKFISGFVMFSLLFGTTFRVPVMDYSTYAGSSDFFNLVSILVDEKTYDDVESEVKRYAEDIQSVLENTKVVILPAPAKASSYEIASLLESLYYEGYKSLDPDVNYESKLVGTVFIGDFELPVVYNKSESSKTIIPYTDFEDKVYIYNHENGKYEKNERNSDGLKSEIWHGFISPNTGSYDGNIQGLKNYFDKNHDYYSGTGNFKYSQGILNGNKNVGVPSTYKPYVFYYDQFREKKALSYEKYKAYEVYLKYLEEIVYNKFSKELADKITKETLAAGSDKMTSMANKLEQNTASLGAGSSFGEVSGSLLSSLKNPNTPDTSNVSDVQTRHIIDNVAKKFIEIFSKGTLGEFRADVHNAGRYNNGGSDVNVDMIPHLISLMDVVYPEMIKEINNKIEDKIDEQVEAMAEGLIIPTKIIDSKDCGVVYMNFYNGTYADDIINVDQCSLFRGSNKNGGKLVEANRGHNANLTLDDLDVLKNEPEAAACLATAKGGEGSDGRWGGNSPLNIKVKTPGEIGLHYSDPDGAIKPLFDISGAKESKTGEEPSISSCSENNFLVVKKPLKVIDGALCEGYFCEDFYESPAYGEKLEWTCLTDNNGEGKTLDFTKSFEEVLAEMEVPIECEKNYLYLDGELIKESIYEAEEASATGAVTYTTTGLECAPKAECENEWGGKKYYFKSISGIIENKSPSPEDLKAQIGSMATPDLPNNTDRSTIFHAGEGAEGKIEYPTLFRFDKAAGEDQISFETVERELAKVLNAKSAEVNSKGGSVNLLSMLKNTKSGAEIAALGSKEMTYYDLMVFAIFWNSLNTVSAKYAFVFDYYLNDQSDNTDQKYKLIKNKKEYEIAYLGATGDPKNMYIKMDPEGKDENPYADILSDNIKLSGELMASNVGGGGGGGGGGESGELGGGGMFECAPPDGVPIWEWLPAVMCRLGNMLPPTISFSEGACGEDTLFMDEESGGAWALSVINEEDDSESGSESGGSESSSTSTNSSDGSNTSDSTTNSCSGIDQDGLTDCFIKDLVRGGKFELSSDSEIYHFNTNAKLKAKFKDRKGNVMLGADYISTNFVIEKIEAATLDQGEFIAKNIKTVYDRNDSSNNDESVISKYANFKDMAIKSTNGVSQYQMGTKSKEANIFVRAYIEKKDSDGKVEKTYKSNLLKIEVRGNKLFNTNYKIVTTEDGYKPYYGIDSLLVSDKTNVILVDGKGKDIDEISRTVSTFSASEEKMVVFVRNLMVSGGDKPLEYPLTVNLYKDSKKVKSLVVTKEDMNVMKGAFSIKKSGSYTLEIIDNDGFRTKKDIDLLPGEPKDLDIQLGSSVMQTGGNISTGFVALYDRYKNITSGEFYDLDFSINGKGIKFLNNSGTKFSTNTFEGYKVFRVFSTQKAGSNDIGVSVFNRKGDVLVGSQKNVEVIKDINLFVKPITGDAKVGGEKYKYELSVRNSDGTIINNFNSRAYLVANDIYLSPTETYVELKNGKAEIEFVTKNVAGEDIPVEFQVEGLAEIEKTNITILPEAPIKIDLVMSRNEIEANKKDYAVVNVELKDRYNNLVFNDSSTRASIDILSQYKHIISADSSINRFNKGKTSFKIYGTSNPGVANFKISTNPSLEENAFIITDQAGEHEIRGVGKNIGQIKTFYFWNKEKIVGKKYNSLYTTMLGASYGDLTVENYLAGSLLFEKNNRALAVTSILNYPYKRSNILKLNENGYIEKIDTYADLSQDLNIVTGFEDGNLKLDLYNNSLGIYIGKVLYKLDTDNELIVCDDDSSACSSSLKTSIGLKSRSNKYSVYKSGNKLLLRDEYGKDLFTIKDDGTIERNGTISYEYTNNNNNNVMVEISTGGSVIGELHLNFVNPTVSTIRNIDAYNTVASTSKNSVILYMNTYSYGTYNSENNKDESKIIYYNDPFSESDTLNVFSKENMYGYENFKKNKGLGWKEGNKSLLAFAAGKTVGDSVKDYMSFSVINHGDPVLSVKKIKKKLPGSTTKRKFDATVGKLIAQDTKLDTYKVLDYDNDDIQDVILIKNDGYIELLENKNIEDRFIDKGDLANISDVGDSELIGPGDFSGDGYDDIFFVNDEGQPYLLNNREKDFNRISLVKDFDIDSRIIIAKVFDMDNDGYDDVVTLEDSGEISIHYSKGNLEEPSFEKMSVGKSSGVKLSTKTRNDNALVYYKGLYQPAEVGNNNKSVDNLIYRPVPYSQDATSVEDFTYEALAAGDVTAPDSGANTHFINSEYSEAAGLMVEKKFTDVNGGFIKASDTIEVEVKLTNTSGGQLSKVAFMDKLDHTFLLDQASVETDKTATIGKGLMGFDYLIDGFDLYAGEVLTIKYKAEVRPIKHSYIDVGLFEDGEVGDDEYGDIILKKSEENCGETVDIFRSLELVSPRSYEEGIKVPSCDSGKAALPNNIKDGDGDGVPDYIESLTAGGGSSAAADDFKSEALDDLNSDAEDLGEISGDLSFLGAELGFDGASLGSVSAEVAASIKDVSNFMKGLSCGFGEASCIAMPLNWAPLAPGSDPVFQGYLLGDGLKVDEGYPIFSSLTGIYVYSKCRDVVFPISPLTQNSCSGNNAGGSLGIDGPNNTIRIFVTPTLTGGIGTAICFGGPARTAGTSVPKAVSPLEPGGNCVVLAEKMKWCEDDGSDGDPASAGIPAGGGGGGGGGAGAGGAYGIINGNCSYSSDTNMAVAPDVVKDYLKPTSGGASSGGASGGGTTGGGNASKSIAVKPSLFVESQNQSMFTDSEGADASVSLDLAALKNGDFEDIIKIEMERIFSFPDWLMEWVTRQIEEIANKLTDWPTLYIILPDLEGIFDTNRGEGEEGGEEKKNDTINLGENLSGNETVDGLTNRVNSGIQEVYDFLGNIPLVYVDQETVNITLPWISDAELDKVVASRELTVQQRKAEIDRATKEWTGGFACNSEIPEVQKKCEEDYAIGNKAAFKLIADIEVLIESVHANIEVIKEYKKLPEKIYELITIKEKYLEQILCNIDSITYILGGRIGENGKRFKAWVEVYILVKSILDTWQAIVDVFINYEEECHDCKNERQDALEWEFMLISLLIPDIPVIRFPKWPDIIVDLHNIRVGLRIALPEFDINTKPIILPSLPNLFLPDVPHLNVTAEIDLPELPVLPIIEIPELPDLPSLPTVELPNLPPPPKLPELLAELQVIIDIAELIIEAMCILKSSPLHPEWRAGDQIAFLTERGGYLPTDLIEVSFPEFSFPFVDAIEVKTLVNLEFETDFIVELAKQVVMPLNNFTNDFVNLFDLRGFDLDFNSSFPKNIDVNVKAEVGMSVGDKAGVVLAHMAGKGIKRLSRSLDARKDKYISRPEFIRKISKDLGSDTITKNHRYDEVRKVWEKANSYTYSKEDKLIEELKENNKEKFEALKDIVNTEIIKNKELKAKFKEYGEEPIVNKVGNNDSKFENYNKELSKYNDKFKESAQRLMKGGDPMADSLKENRENLLGSINTPLQKYSKEVEKSFDKKLLAATTTSSTTSAPKTSCQVQAEGTYKYEYEGIYILEGGTSYRLFDYLDELNGDEFTTPVDVDKDGDEDLLYSIEGQVFFKENLEIVPTKTYVTTKPIVLDKSDNKFFNGDTFYEAVNNAYEIGSGNGRINLYFSTPTDKTINNFRLGFYTIVDKYLNVGDYKYTPKRIRKDIIDAFADIENSTFSSEDDSFISRKNLAYIDRIGNSRDLKLKTKELINIKDDIGSNAIVNIKIRNTLYAGDKSFKIDYYEESDVTKEIKTLSVKAHNNVELKKDIMIVGITGNAYLEGTKVKYYKGTEVLGEKGKPLLPGATLSYVGDKDIIINNTYAEIEYYDGSRLNIDFEETHNWELYDLGQKADDYYISTYRFNDYYYSKISSFKKDIDSTISRQILLSPQSASDQSPPSLSIDKIRIPVYQKKEVDFTPYIYEFGGINNIDSVYIDMDLETDTSGDGNTKNDNDAELDGDYKNMIKVNHSLISLKVEFGKFKEVFKRNIGIALIDSNGNVGFREVIFEVYPPIPKIEDFTGGIVGGKLDEELNQEPVSLFRYRGGAISKLKDQEGGIKSLTDDGNFKFNVSEEKGGLDLYKGAEKIGFVNEKTGKISLINGGSLSTDVIASNDVNNEGVFPKIIVKSGSEEIFYEFIKINKNNKVQPVDGFSGLTERGLYFKLDDKTTYSYYTLPESVPSGQGALVVFRQENTQKEPLFTIYKDGRIDTINYNYKLSYDTFGDYVTIKLIDAHYNKEVGEVMYLVDAEYIME